MKICSYSYAHYVRLPLKTLLCANRSRNILEEKNSFFTFRHDRLSNQEPSWQNEALALPKPRSMDQDIDTPEPFVQNAWLTLVLMVGIIFGHPYCKFLLNRGALASFARGQNFAFQFNSFTVFFPL